MRTNRGLALLRGAIRLLADLQRGVSGNFLTLPVDDAHLETQFKLGKFIAGGRLRSGNEQGKDNGQGEKTRPRPPPLRCHSEGIDVGIDGASTGGMSSAWSWSWRRDRFHFRRLQFEHLSAPVCQQGFWKLQWVVIAFDWFSDFNLRGPRGPAERCGELA